MESPEKKIVSFGSALGQGFHIYFAERLYEEYTTQSRQDFLDSLSDLSLAKAYYSCFMAGHCGRNCFKCGIRNNCSQTLMKSGTSEQFLPYDLFDRFEEAEEPTPYFDVFFKQNQKRCEVVYGKNDYKFSDEKCSGNE